MKKISVEKLDKKILSHHSWLEKPVFGENKRLKIKRFFFDEKYILSFRDFTESVLKSCYFKNVDLEYSIFNHANCKRVKFESSSLVGASFFGANLKNAVFKNMVLDNVDFRNSNFERAKLDNVFFKDCLFK